VITYTERWAEGAEEIRKRLFANSTASLWGKSPTTPRGPMKLLDLDWAWYAVNSAHELKQETGQAARERTLDFFIGWRAGLTQEVIDAISGVVLDGKRYATATEPRAQVSEPRFLRVICWPTGEMVS